MIAADYQMSNDLQASTLAMAIIVVIVMAWGIWALAVDAKDRWSIEDVEAEIDAMARDHFIGRDLHTEVRDQMQGKRAG